MAKLTSKEPLEKEIEKKTIRLIKNSIVVKFYKRNWPDRLVFAPQGTVFFIEFKREGEPLRPSQNSVKKVLEQLGFVVYVVDNEAKGKLIADLKNEI